MRRIKELVNIFGSFWPIFSIFFLILASIFNKTSYKGIIYLFGLIIVVVIWNLVFWFRDSKTDENLESSETGTLICNLSTLNILNFYEVLAATDLTINIRPIAYVYPLSTPVLWYTNLYLILTLFHGKHRPGPNVVILAIFIIGSLCNILSNISFSGCITRASNVSATNIGFGIFFGVMVGIGVGVAWFFTISAAEPSLLFSDILYQNNAICKLNVDRKYQCQLYQNEEFKGNI